MSLSRLQELSSLLPAQVQEQAPAIQEGVSSHQFHAVLDYVNDSLADLEDALGVGGSIEHFAGPMSSHVLANAFEDFKRLVEKHMTHIEVDLMADEAGSHHEMEEAMAGSANQGKDDEGKNIVTTQGGKTVVTRAKKIIRSTGDSHTIQDENGRTVTVRGKVAEGRLTEAKDYDDSGDFTEELLKVGAQIGEIEKIVHSPRWENWMQVTDDNFSTSAASLNSDFVSQLSEVDTAYRALKAELINAGS
jgi:hypothetical protein